MGYSYKGSINFGLVYIPIELHSTVVNNDISFNQIDKKTMSRVKYIKTCVDCDERIVSAEDIVKGYEYEKGKYVIFDDEDFEKIKTERDKSIKIEQFVNIKEIDPLYFDKPYYVNPTGGDAAFKLLLTAMEQENKAGIAKAVLGNKETLIAIRAKGGEMLLNTLFFAEEVRTNPSGQVNVQVDEGELKMAKAIITGMTAPFEPEKYHDEYRKKLEQAIEMKIAGKEISAADEGMTDNSAGSLMDALQASLAEMNAGKTGEGAKAKKRSAESAADKDKKAKADAAASDKAKKSAKKEGKTKGKAKKGAKADGLKANGGKAGIEGNGEQAKKSAKKDGARSGGAKARSVRK